MRELKYTGDFTPEYMSNGALGADVRAVADYTIYPGEVVLVDTGVAIELPEDRSLAAMVLPRSGISRGLRLCNSPGLVDADYRGTIKFKYQNVHYHETPIHIKKGDRIGQLIFVPCEVVNFKKVKTLSDTERGEDGFGSTGKR